MKCRISFVSVFLCLSLMMITSARPGSAQTPKAPKPEPVWLSQMRAEGWQKVTEGVLQRTAKGGAIETFTYGEKGRLWRVKNLQERISFLVESYNAQPSEELAKAIDHLQGDLALSQQRVSVAAPQTLNLDKAGCDFAFGAHADAFPLSGNQAPGVGASADSYFHNNCGYLGDTYALAYVDGWVGAVHTTKTQETPKSSGTWLDSLAQQSESASSSCSSRAYASVTSSALGIFYQIEDWNYICPAPLVVSISGPTDVYTDDYTPCATVTWTASVSGGTPAYGTINWYIGTTYQGSGSTLTQDYCYANQTVTVRAVVSDSGGQTVEGSFSTTFHYTVTDVCGGDPCCGRYCCYQAITSSESPELYRPPYCE